MITVSGYTYGFDAEECTFSTVSGALEYFYLMLEIYSTVDMTIAGYLALSYESGSLTYYYAHAGDLQNV